MSADRATVNGQRPHRIADEHLQRHHAEHLLALPADKKKVVSKSATTPPDTRVIGAWGA
jgi:hypothetical protein